jgi:hypothetical protein
LKSEEEDPATRRSHENPAASFWGVTGPATLHFLIGVHPGVHQPQAIRAWLANRYNELSARSVTVPVPALTMAIGKLTLEVSIPHAQSLKDRRQVVRSLKDKLRHTFNLSIAELN